MISLLRQLALLIILAARVMGGSPAEGLDSTLSWTVSGNSTWETAPSASAVNGGDVARARQPGDATMETVVSGPATVSFSWRLSGPDGRGWLSLRIGGHEMATLRRGLPWQRVDINLPPGSHTLRIGAHGMARVPGAAAEVDHFVVNAGARLPWLTGVDEDPAALWVATGSSQVAAEVVPSLSGIDDGQVATMRGTGGSGRTSLMRLVQGPARLVPRVNVKGGSFVGRDLDSVGAIRRVNSSTGNTWNASPIIVGPGIHRVEWVHFYWAQLEDEKDPHPQVLPGSVNPAPTDVATLAGLAITPLTLDTTVPGGLTWTSTGSNPFVPTLADRDNNSLNQDQQAALSVERPLPNQDARLSTVIDGPAEVRLSARFEGPAGDTFRIVANGELKYDRFEGGGIGMSTFEIPAGPVTVEVVWTSGPLTDPLRRASIVDVEVRQVIPQAVRDALGAPAGVSLYTSNPELWDTADADPREGLAARNRPFLLNPGAFPELSAWVDGPAVLTYWRRADVPAGTSLGFPGVMSASNPGPFTWQPVSVPVPDGRHRLVWHSPYAQGIMPQGSRYYLDGFTVEPGNGVEAVPIAEALDTPGRIWTASEVGVTSGNLGQLALDGVDAVALSPDSEGAPSWIETTVTGPAIFTVHHSRSLPGITLDGGIPNWGVTDDYLPEDSLWRRLRMPIPAGDHVVRLSGSDPRYPATLDMVEVTPQPALSFAEAVDAPGLTFTSGGDRWQGLHSPEASDEVDSLFAGGEQGTGWIATEITGPARVEFVWRAGPDGTRLSLEMDGTEILVASAYQPWENVAVEIPAGTHAFRWVFSSPADRPGSPAGLDQLSVQPLPGLTLADALESPGRTWITRGPLPSWTAQTGVTHDGQDAAGVPTYDDETISSGSVLQTTVTGPVLVRFRWHKDGPGFARCQMDERDIAELTVEDEWQEVTLAIPPGDHILRWATFKNHYFEPRPSLHVDDFRIESLPTSLTLAEVLKAPSLPWRTSTSAPWEHAWRGLPGGGYELAAISPAPEAGTTWIETDVTGPAVLSFVYLDDTFGLGSGKLIVNGEPVMPLAGATWPDDAIPVRWPLPAGTHTIRWEWTPGGTPLGSTRMERLMIDRVEVATGRPEIASLFPAGVDLELVGHPWTVQPTPGGGFRAESQPVSSSVDLMGSPIQSRLNMTVPGNRELAFRTGWTGLRTNRVGGMFFNAGGLWYNIHGVGGTTAETLNSVWHLPPGSDHLLRFTTASGQGTLDAMFLDQVSLEEPAHPLGEALGVPGKVFLSSGSGRWHGQTAVTHGDGAAVSSGGDGSLTTFFTGPGTVSWWWKSEGVSTGANVGLIAYPNGQASVLAARSGSFGWERREVVIPWGQTFRLEWRTAGYEAGRLILDEVAFRESVSDTYTAWAISKIGAGERAPMNADPDGDGQSNLMEFAFGSNPLSARSAYTQDLRIENGQIRLCLTLPEHDTTGLNYDLEFSTDLVHWERVHRIPGGPSIPDEPVICPVPAEATGDRGFVRIRLSMGEDQE
ncbi:hypothetical protein OKA04_04040 [Luteolibacter flavescens]|uniref:Uncharacterized protein n=1 Tax=Luteolibacter flavescens TaxID=1859460 RepID=A0ABT3FJY1_9BACT|nr:hypothetical protein [Luteolibacter flavescens]MCW1883884.1 hypothetical protein [Luteolibacter flavescens]